MEHKQYKPLIGEIQFVLNPETQLPFCFQDGMRLVGMEQIGLERAATEMDFLLRRTYGEHDLSRTRDGILNEMSHGRIIPRFLLEGTVAVAQSALVETDKTIELGRTTGPGGGLLMRRLAAEWWHDPSKTKPLVAETRMAAPTDDIDGGQGSQATLLPEKKVGMIPHAFMPSYRHPGPAHNPRNELFGFLSKEKPGYESNRIAPKTINLPNRPEMNLKLINILLGINGFESVICESGQLLKKEFRLFEGNNGVPFNMVNLKGEKEYDPKGKRSPFDLVELDTFDSDLAEQAEFLITKGFICCGISAPYEGSLKLKFGRLHMTELTPTEVMKNMSYPELTDLIMQLHQQFVDKMQSL